jgi:hypothetical protein
LSTIALQVMPCVHTPWGIGGGKPAARRHDVRLAGPSLAEGVDHDRHI